MDDYLTWFQIGGDFQQMVRKRNFIMKVTNLLKIGVYEVVLL